MYVPTNDSRCMAVVLQAYAPAHVAATRNHPTALSCLAYDCKVVIVGPGAANSKVRPQIQKSSLRSGMKGVLMRPGEGTSSSWEPASEGVCVDCVLQGQEPIDAARESEGAFAACAVLRKLQASRDRLYKGANTNNCVLPTFSEDFESVYQSNSRPFSRKSAGAM